jgi:hypothetical protein
MSGYREQLTGALLAAAVTSQTSYSWFGHRSRPLPRELCTALPRRTARTYLIHLLEGELYRSFFTQGRPVPAGLSRLNSARPNPQFVDALSEANCGVGGWESGWRVEASEYPFLFVRRNGLCARVRAAECDAPGDPAAGTWVRIRRPKELRAASPGFYTALGNAEPTAGPQEPEVRVYFNVTPTGAPPLIAACTGLLNDANLPFDLKVIDSPSGFGRRDCAVLYLAGDGYKLVRAELEAITSACARHLRDGVPAFTKSLARGVAVGAHRPQRGSSFGGARCRLIAEALVAAHEAGMTAIADRVEAVTRRFAAEGLDIESPYLAPRGVHNFEL